MEDILRQRTNAERIEHMERVVEEYAAITSNEGDSNEEIAVDLLADLYHWCWHHKIDLEAVQRMAADHFATEHVAAQS